MITASTPLSIDDKVKEMMRSQSEHIEMMAAAYLKATNIDPRRVELVQENQGLKIVWYFRERQGEQDKG